MSAMVDFVYRSASQVQKKAWALRVGPQVQPMTSWYAVEVLIRWLLRTDTHLPEP